MMADTAEEGGGSDFSQIWADTNLYLTIQT